MSDSVQDLSEMASKATLLRDKLHNDSATWFVGNMANMDLLLAARIAMGHVLLSGPPGVAKTTVAKAFGKWCGETPVRIQFSPDMLPMDITGGYALSPDTGKLVLKKGPVFHSFVVADEINRAPGRAHATMLEALEEGHVSIEGETHSLGDQFFLVATQNPQEASGTYALPDALLDRFSMNIDLPYPEEKHERALYTGLQPPSEGQRVAFTAIDPGIPELLHACSLVVPRVYISPELIDYSLQIVRSLRGNPGVFQGPSPRAGLTWIQSARAFALCQGRHFVTVDDLQRTGPACLLHRTQGAGMASLPHDIGKVLEGLFKTLPYIAGAQP